MKNYLDGSKNQVSLQKSIPNPMLGRRVVNTNG